MQYIDDIITLINTSLRDEEDTSTSHIIRCGYDEEVDRLVHLLEHSHEWVGEYQKQLIEQTGIQKLKIKFTNNIGYFIEIPAESMNLIPDAFIFKQRLTHAYRYTSQELSQFGEEIFSAEDMLHQREKDIFLSICNSINEHFDELYGISRNISDIDFYTNAAYISGKNRYTRPEISSHYALSITEGRHPVLESLEGEFISNDLCLHKKDAIHIITGPNMGGKSTYLRQNALLLLMAHMGFDIPVNKAEIPLIDGIFSRVGSGDNLFLGQSTFMVEMQEIAYILNHATEKSFIIIDEIGRGTSTYDGMSLAWAILKYLHDTIRVKTLFATHYHEITDHANQLKHTSNYCVAVSENLENIVFLRKIIPGAIKKSYGIEVAKLSGLPLQVLEIAKKTLQSYQTEQMSLDISVPHEEQHSQTDTYIDTCMTQIQEKDLNTMTPIEALAYLHHLQKQLENKK